MKSWTFLFTDIEGSTAHCERAPGRYREALARHFALLQAAIGEHGGEIFRNTGDGLLSVFTDSSAALAAAAACQRAIRQFEWPEQIGELRVRIGIHRGEAEESADDFHGLVMHHATRVLDAANGGQILCSAVVREHASEEWRSALEDLGLYRLRGAPAPVRLFQVGYEGMPERGFPPLRTAAAFTHQLPSRATRFFGRQAELLELALLLGPKTSGISPRNGGRLVTLLGPGGTGKTRLSLAIAERLLSTYSHAVWFIELAELRDGGLLAEALADGLGLVQEPGLPPLEQVIQFVKAQPTLLILDNFEQLVPGGVPAVRRLLEGAPHLVCLVSSRVRLDLQAEQIFSIAPLLLPPANGTTEELLRYPSVELFCDRARSVDRSFHLNGENAAAVAAICSALEGIPLAIELAAARANVLTPRQVLAKLEHRLDFLVTRNHDFASRHRTLRATVAWSYELLSAAGQRAFRQLAVFRGGCSLPAAEAILAAAELGALGALEMLDELVSGSLIVATKENGEMRYLMLEVLRDYAFEKLTEGDELPTVERRHQRFFFKMTTGAAGGGTSSESERLRAFDADHENIRTVVAGQGPIDERVAMAKTLRTFWMIRGHLAEGRKILERLIPEVSDPAQRAILQNDAGILAWSAGELQAARAHFDAALPIFEASGDEKSVAGILNNIGILANDQNDTDGARAYYARSLAIYRRLGLRSNSAAVLSNLGSTYVEGDAPEKAAEFLEEALAVQRELGEQFNSANTLLNLAEMRGKLGHHAEARSYFAESLTTRRSLGARHDVVECFCTLGDFARAEGLRELAALLYSAARLASESLENRPGALRIQSLDGSIAALRSEIDADRFSELWRTAERVDLGSVLAPDGAWSPELLQAAHVAPKNAA